MSDPCGASVMGLDDTEPGHPVVSMTTFTYWSRWAIAGIVALAAARLFLVQPILDALKHWWPFTSLHRQTT